MMSIHPLQDNARKTMGILKIYLSGNLSSSW